MHINNHQPLSDTLVFLEELANLTAKRNGCVLDEGVFLTDTGSELVKRVKIKPQPGPRRGRTIRMAVSQLVESNEKVDKQIDENSQSSNEDKPGDAGEKTTTTTVENEKKQQQKRQHANIGVGGFSLKVRNRSRAQFVGEIVAAVETNEKQQQPQQQQRKKKSQFEEMMPAYMQEAFFGTSTIAEASTVDCASSLENELAVVDDAKLAAKREQIMAVANSSHCINLDENVFKMAQQNKKGHLELGIEDFLDGDIVSYLFNENRNLMEFNPEPDMGPTTTTTTTTSNAVANSSGAGSSSSSSSSSVSGTVGVGGGADPKESRLLKESTTSSSTTTTPPPYDEKIFDEKIYEDIFHQMAGGGVGVSDSGLRPGSTTPTANTSSTTKTTSSGKHLFDSKLF